MSRFVSAGTDDNPSERDEAWQKAQDEIEAKHRSKLDAGGKQESGKSLYETLQANKAAKQEAFEESIRLKNQFRSLDDDEVEFLDSVLESTRAKEAEVRKETSEQLDAFRRRQEEAEKAGVPEDEAEEVEVEAWKAGPRKRKKGRESVIGGVKLRRTSTVEKDAGGEMKLSTSVEESPPPSANDSREVQKDPTSPAKASSPTSAKGSDEPTTKTSPAPAASLGLAAYSSDEDE